MMNFPSTGRAIESIEVVLARAFGRRFCCLTNRGTTALAAALHAMDLPEGTPVIFPAAVCSIPVFSALFVGLTPHFADVNLCDGNFDLESLEDVLRGIQGPSAVIPIHMFGKPDALAELDALCERHGAVLIEDCALSMGARYGGRRVGGFGQASTLSFVRKMVPLEMGGAVLTDDPLVDQRARTFVSRLPCVWRDEDQVTSVMKAFHRLTARVARDGWRQCHLFDSFKGTFRELLLVGTRGTDWEVSMLPSELEQLEDHLKAREVRAEVYENVLVHERIVPMGRLGSSLFAFPIRLNSVPVEDFLDFVRSRGVEFKRIAYPDVHKVFPRGRNQPDELFRNARTLEEEVIGMPLDERFPTSSYWDYAQKFLDLFIEYLSAGRDRQLFDATGRLEMRMS